MWPAVVTTHPILADLFLPASKKADLKSPTIVISLLSTAFLDFRKHSRGSEELILSILEKNVIIGQLNCTDPAYIKEENGVVSVGSKQ